MPMDCEKRRWSDAACHWLQLQQLIILTDYSTQTEVILYYSLHPRLLLDHATIDAALGFPQSKGKWRVSQNKMPCRWKISYRSPPFLLIHTRRWVEYFINFFKRDSRSFWHRGNRPDARRKACKREHGICTAISSMSLHIRKYLMNLRSGDFKHRRRDQSD